MESHNVGFNCEVGVLVDLEDRRKDGVDNLVDTAANDVKGYLTLEALGEKRFKEVSELDVCVVEDFSDGDFCELSFCELLADLVVPLCHVFVLFF